LVLVAEDNRVNQKVLTLYLAQIGYQAERADNGLEAVDRWIVQRYDVIFMDARMPEMDGIEATMTIREFEASSGRPRTPIIAVTASTRTEDRDACYAAGMDDFVTKPLQRDELVKILRKWHTTAPEPTALTLPVPSASDTQDAITAQQRILGQTYEELVMIFIHTTPQQLQHLAAAIARLDVRVIADTAHALRGGAATLGALQFASLAAQIEDQARSNYLADLESHLGELQASYQLLVARLAPPQPIS
jgi:CheY-like chemotaxis protein